MSVVSGVLLATGCARFDACRLFLRAAPAHRAPPAAQARSTRTPELSAETTEYLLAGMPPQFSDAYHMQRGARR